MVTAAMKLKDTCSFEATDSTLKSRDITLSTKVCLAKAMVFPVVMYGCELDYKESWVPKNLCFWTVVLEKTLESPLDCKGIKPVHPEGDQSWIFIEELMLNLKLEYFGYLMWRTYSFEKTLMLGKIEGRRKRGRQRMRWLDGITDLKGKYLSKFWGFGDGHGSPACYSPWGCRVGHDWVTELHVMGVPVELMVLTVVINS